MLEVLKEKHALNETQTVERVVFNAITKQAVTGGDEASAPDRRRAGRRLSRPPRARLSGRLHALAGAVAQAARAPARPAACSRWRCGWSATASSRSRNSSPREYWSLVATLATPRGDTFEARLVGADGQKIQRLDIGSGDEAEAFKQALESAALRGRQCRGQAGPAQPAPALHHLDPAAGGEPQARLRAGAHHADRAAALRGRRHRRRDRRPHHLYAYRRRRHRRRGDRRGAQRDRRRLRQPLRAGRAAPLPDQGEERAGSARGDPPDRPRPPSAGRSQSVPRCRPGPALRADLAAHAWRARWNPPSSSAPPSTSPPRSGAPHASTCAPPARWSSSTASSRSITRTRDDPSDDDESQPPAGDERRRGAAEAQDRRRPSISPSRRRAIRKPRWSSAWRSSASAGPRPMPRSCRC